MDAAVTRLSGTAGQMEFACGKLRYRNPAWMPDYGTVADSFKPGYILKGSRQTAGERMMGDTTPIREPRRGLTFEDVWAALMETREQSKETGEQIKEMGRKMEETDRRMKETDRRIGELGNRFGELAEHLVTPNIAEKFRALGYAFTRTGSDVEFLNRDGTPLTEVDVWLENGEFVMAVEVKSRLRKGDVDGHVKRMAILRSYFDERGDARKLLGAVAGAIVPRELKQYVRRKGFYLIEQSGDTVQIDVPQGFTPRIW